MFHLQLRTMQLLNQADKGDHASRLCDALISTLVVLNVIAITLESYQPIYQAYATAFDAFEIFSIAFFTVEYALRVWSNAARTPQTPWTGRFQYIFSFHGVVDLIAILPFYLQTIMTGVDMRILRMVRLVRLLKLSHYSSALQDLFDAIRAERRAFGATLYLLTIALTLSSALMYYAEASVQPDKLHSIPHAMYWSLITLTTVGFGDISPITPIGKVIAMVTALIGVSTVAILTGIVASSFANQVARRKAIYEKELRVAYEDGVLSPEEQKILAELQERFDLGDELVQALKDEIKAETNKPRSRSKSQV
jgi:voltage-gated potassium channel